MNAGEIRAKYWRIRSRIEQPGTITPTLDREIALLQAEMLTELAAQQAETNELLKRTLGIVNFEKLALQLDEVLKEKS